MPTLNLVLRRKSDDIMIFSPAPWFRILFLVLTAAIAVGLYAVYGDLKASGEPMTGLIVPTLIGIFCLAGMLYEEIWIFDRKQRIIYHRFGLKILSKKSAYSFDDSESLELVIFLRGAESDGSADHEITIGKRFGKTTDGMNGIKNKIIHPKYHQELLLNISDDRAVKIETIDSRNTESLEKKAGILSDFTGLPLVKE